MKGLLFSRVMRTDTYFMSRSRAPPPLPPASVFQTVVLLLLNLFVSLLEPPVKTPLIVFVLFASLFILLSLPCWLFPLYSFCLSFCPLIFSRHPVFSKKLTKIVSDTPVLLLCPQISIYLMAYVIGRESLRVDKTRSLGHHGKDDVSL